MKNLLRKLASPLLEARRLRRWPKQPPYNYTNEPRKPTDQIHQDLRRWKEKFGSFSFDYFEYGADIVGRDVEDYVPYDLFKDYRYASNSRLDGKCDFNYDCLLEDKLVFSRFADSLGYPVPTTYAVLDPDRFEVSRTREVHAPDVFGTVFDGYTGILKPVLGGEGADVFLLEISEGTVFLNSEAVASADLFGRLTTKYIFQELVRQHPALARLNESSVNTLRMITAQKDGRAIALGAVLRVGGAGAHIDNWSQGGIVVNVDLERGEISGKGTYKAGNPTVDVHPGSGIRLDGYPLPNVQECVETACAFHDDLYGLHSIGWDIAITEEGPSFLEGNAYWSGFVMASIPKIMPRYLDTLDTLPPKPYRHQNVRLID